MGHRRHHDSHDHHHHEHDHPHGARSRGRRPGFDSGFSGGPGFGHDMFDLPFGPRRRGGRARRGDVRAALLGLLADGPNSGYGLMHGIHERSDGAWRPSPGSVYPTLQQLVDEELVSVTGDGRRSEYTLTDDGRAYVEEHREELDRAWNLGADRHAEHAEYAAFRESAMKLFRVVRQFPGDATPEQRTAAIEKMDDLRKSLYGLLAE